MFWTRIGFQGLNRGILNKNANRIVKHSFGVDLTLTRNLFIQTENTPNPNSIKFIPGEEVLPKEYGNTMNFKKTENYSNSPLAKKLFRISGIEGVMLGGDFISVIKSEGSNWSQLKPEIFETIMELYDSQKPAVTSEKPEMAEKVGSAGDSEEDSEVVELIKELLDERIRPMVQEDGGDIHYQSFDAKTGVVTVKLTGSCESCPSSTVTLKNGVENMLMHYIPEITRVEQFYEQEVLNERKLQWTPSV